MHQLTIYIINNFTQLIYGAQKKNIIEIVNGQVKVDSREFDGRDMLQLLKFIESMKFKKLDGFRYAGIYSSIKIHFLKWI